MARIKQWKAICDFLFYSADKFELHRLHHKAPANGELTGLFSPEHWNSFILMVEDEQQELRNFVGLDRMNSEPVSH